MTGCDIRAAVIHAVPGGVFSRPELSDVDVVCGRPSDWKVRLRGLDHGNHREEAQVIEVELCNHHLQAFQQLDNRLHSLGWSRSLHGAALPIDAPTDPAR